MVATGAIRERGGLLRSGTFHRACHRWWRDIEHDGRVSPTNSAAPPHPLVWGVLDGVTALVTLMPETRVAGRRDAGALHPPDLATADRHSAASSAVSVSRRCC
jgi:hypothetical protein